MPRSKVTIHNQPLQEADWLPIASANWGEAPQGVEAKVRMAYTPDCVQLEYQVIEPTVRALHTQPQSAVFEDSCVEFFFSAEAWDGYFNLECNAIGTLLAAFGPSRSKRKKLELDQLARIETQASLGREPFSERPAVASWTVQVALPFHLLPGSPPQAGAEWTVNFYKCGNALSPPHYLSWNPIESTQPDFHRPECFGTLVFS